jgi:hypothetical protein
MEPVLRDDAHDAWIAAVLCAAMEGSLWNRRAALATASSVLLSTATTVAGLYI